MTAWNTRPMFAVSSSAPRCGPSSPASASVSGVKPLMSANRADPRHAVGQRVPGVERPAAVAGDVCLGSIARGARTGRSAACAPRLRIAGAEACAGAHCGAPAGQATATSRSEFPAAERGDRPAGAARRRAPRSRARPSRAARRSASAPAASRIAGERQARRQQPVERRRDRHEADADQGHEPDAGRRRRGAGRGRGEERDRRPGHEREPRQARPSPATRPPAAARTGPRCRSTRRRSPRRHRPRARRRSRRASPRGTPRGSRAGRGRAPPSRGRARPTRCPWPARSPPARRTGPCSSGAARARTRRWRRAAGWPSGRRARGPGSPPCTGPSAAR